MSHTHSGAKNGILHVGGACVVWCLLASIVYTRSFVVAWLLGVCWQQEQAKQQAFLGATQLPRPKIELLVKKLGLHISLPLSLLNGLLFTCLYRLVRAERACPTAGTM